MPTRLLDSSALLEFAPDAIVGIGADGRIELANSQVETLFGWPRAELIGEPVEVLVPERYRAGHEAHRAGYFRAPRTRPMGAGLELYALRSDGTEFPCEISLSATKHTEGIVAVAAVRDVTERKRFEEDLRQANAELERANQAKDRFLASMSHELRTPLNAILGFTGTLLMGLPGELNDEQRRQLETVQSNGSHLLSIINDLLDVAKIESGKVEVKLEPIACAPLVTEVVAGLQPLAEEKGLGFEVEVSDAPPEVLSDRRALSQILINLTNNAIKYTDAGQVRLEVDTDGQGGNGGVRFRVSDTGKGIKAEQMEKLFEPFEQLGDSATRRYEGTGLGLYISRRLAELIGARLRARSQYGEGSTFTLELAASPDRSGEALQ